MNKRDEIQQLLDDDVKAMVHSARKRVTAIVHQLDQINKQLAETRGRLSNLDMMLDAIIKFGFPNGEDGYGEQGESASRSADDDSQ